jgi:hypothetical protein
LLIKGLDLNQRLTTNSEIHDLVVNRSSAQEDSSSITIPRFLRQCKAKGLFNKLIEYVYYLVHLDLGFKTFYDLFVYIFNSDFRGSEVQTELLTLWFETIRKLEPEIRNLMVYRFKLDIERRFENNQEGLSREYEQFRFELRADHERIALVGKCLNCKRKISSGVHYSEYIKFITEPGHDSSDCPQCNTKGSLVFLYSNYSSSPNYF